MKKKIFFTFLLALSLTSLLLFADKTSTGAPVSSTGAPNEKTCATSGCHDDNPVNVTNSKITLITDSSSSNGITNNGNSIFYLTLKVEYPEFERYGFQLVALDDQGNSLGDLILLDSTNTQILQGDELSNRSYLTYTFNGTIPKNKGEQSWRFAWKSPKNTNSEEVNFYIACVAGNNDKTDKGDYVFLKKIESYFKTLGTDNSQKTVKYLELK